MKISGSTIIVTGGASGMGLATVKHLSKLGAKVAVLDRDLKPLDKAAMAVECDVTDEKSTEKALAQVQRKLGAMRAVVHCAGIIHSRRMVNKEGPLSLDVFRQVININLIGTFNVMRLAAHMMQTLAPLGEDAERGVIINTASIAAFEGQIGQTAYSASKSAVVGMTLPAARELAPFGIRVMTIAPGLVDTPMFATLTPKAKAALVDSIPYPQRLLHATEYAALVAHIITNTALNGTVIRLDAALRLR